MSLKKISKVQPELFEFTPENLQKAKIEIGKYPKEKKASAVIALLYLVQNQNDNWIPLAGIKYVANLLNIPYIKVYEVVTFYSMFNLSPVGKYFVQVCTTTPCMIRGANKIMEICKKNISQNQNELSNNNESVDNNSNNTSDRQLFSVSTTTENDASTEYSNLKEHCDRYGSSPYEGIECPVTTSEGFSQLTFKKLGH